MESNQELIKFKEPNGRVRTELVSVPSTALCTQYILKKHKHIYQKSPLDAHRVSYEMALARTMPSETAFED